ncbi:hypothetical protein PMAYCL1PPCAC_32117, partial [Pristionchus mayeri]
MFNVYIFSLSATLRVSLLAGVRWTQKQSFCSVLCRLLRSANRFSGSSASRFSCARNSTVTTWSLLVFLAVNRPFTTRFFFNGHLSIIANWIHGNLIISLNVGAHSRASRMTDRSKLEQLLGVQIAKNPLERVHCYAKQICSLMPQLFHHYEFSYQLAGPE